MKVNYDYTGTQELLPVALSGQANHSKEPEKVIFLDWTKFHQCLGMGFLTAGY